MIGNANVGKPDIDHAGNWGASNGWSPTPDMFIPVPQVADGVYQLTLTVGRQLAATDVNFKFFHQAGYGNDNADEFNVRSGSPCHISTTSNIFRVDTQESGNIKLASGVTLTEGTTYVFTIDCTDPANAVLTVADAATNGIHTAPYSSNLHSPLPMLFDLQGHRVNNPQAKGLYISHGRKVILHPLNPKTDGNFFRP